jgi:dihydrofolate reductase
MKTTIIAAVAKNGVIGKNNQLLWRIPADMKFFKEKTHGHCCIMGRKTYESIPERFRPLPGRVNIIVTKNIDYHQDGTIVVHSIESALHEAKLMNETECFIIGGSDIYKQTMSIVDDMWITRISENFDGDVEFPYIDNLIWHNAGTCKTEHLKDEKHNHDFDFSILHYTRKEINCIECSNKANWFRHTQFAGSHPYCDTCANKEPDFKDFCKI